jgi:hypothetical protein
MWLDAYTERMQNTYLGFVEFWLGTLQIADTLNTRVLEMMYVKNTCCVCVCVCMCVCNVYTYACMYVMYIRMYVCNVYTYLCM